MRRVGSGSELQPGGAPGRRPAVWPSSSCGRPARPAAVALHGDLHETREMLPPARVGAPPRLAASESRARKAANADSAATGCAVARAVPHADGVEHPDRDLLSVTGVAHKPAARRRARCSLDHLVEANGAPPRDATVEDGDLVAGRRTVGLVVKGCTTPAPPLGPGRAHALRGIRRSKTGETGGLTTTRTKLNTAAKLSSDRGPPLTERRLIML